jgi:AraC-like DNA-binding protein
VPPDYEPPLSVGERAVEVDRHVGAVAEGLVPGLAAGRFARVTAGAVNTARQLGSFEHRRIERPESPRANTPRNRSSRWDRVQTDRHAVPVFEQSIAAANHISLRHLYRLWSHNDLGLTEWIIVERLARAAEALASERQQRRPISAIAYSLGFKDAAHFSRRSAPLTGFLPTSGGEMLNTTRQLAAFWPLRASSRR